MMNCELGKSVQWQEDDGSLHTGQPVVWSECGGPFYVSSSGLKTAQWLNGHDVEVLVAHSYTRDLSFVAWGKLKPYPSEPIPEPTK